jgi:hypothetical protein
LLNLVLPIASNGTFESIAGAYFVESIAVWMTDPSRSVPIMQRTSTLMVYGVGQFGNMIHSLAEHRAA